MRCRRFLQMLRDGAGKFANSLRRAMGVLVHRLIGSGARIAEVGRDVDAVHSCARRLGRRQQAIDDGRGDAVGCRGEQGAARRAPHDGLDLVETGEFEIRVGVAQVRECAGDRSTGLTVRQNGGDGELRMPRDQAQQLSGHIAGAAEHDGGGGTVHSPATLDSRTWLIPSQVMMWSPRSAGLLMALNAWTFICSRMISMPT